MNKIKKIIKKAHILIQRTILQIKKLYVILYGIYLYKKIECRVIYISLSYKLQKFFLQFLIKMQALKYKLSFTGCLWNLCCIILVGCISYFVFFKANAQDVAFWQAFWGFVLGIYGTYAYENTTKLFKEIIFLNLTIPCINSIYGMANSVFQSFFNHPLDDDICKKGDDIIYIAPCKSGGGYDEKLMIKYTNMIENIDFDTFSLHFQENKTRVLIQELKNNSFYFDNAYSTIQHRQDSIDNNLFIVYSQFYQELNGFLYLNSFNWQDTQIKYKLFMQLKILIYKNNMTLLLAQKELSKLEKYLEYASSINSKMKQKHIEDKEKIQELIDEIFDHLTKLISNFSKKEKKNIYNNISKFSFLKNIKLSMDNNNG